MILFLTGPWIDALDEPDRHSHMVALGSHKMKSFAQSVFASEPWRHRCAAAVVDRLFHSPNVVTVRAGNPKVFRANCVGLPLLVELL